MSEDCLYLSVETPAKSKNDKLPVFVMIHGGAFLTGSYSGTQESFVKEGIIYCSIEYRLGALGFMAHPELSKESGKNISGNYGILDQVMALNGFTTISLPSVETQTRLPLLENLPVVSR